MADEGNSAASSAIWAIALIIIVGLLALVVWKGGILNAPTEKKVDKRATLFWAPHIQTDSTGFATISFYNQDSETTATGIIEGISRTGVPGVATIKYEVKKD